LLGLRNIDRERVEDRALDRAHRGGDVDASALHRRLDQAPRVRLEAAEHAGELEGDVEVPVIDRLALDREDDADARGFRPSIAGHAPDHATLDWLTVRGNSGTTITGR